MRILVSNDDGVNAPGINSLFNHLQESFPDYEIKMCAPSMERSSTGHGLSLHDPLRLVEFGVNRYGCSGLPADAAFLGLTTLYDNCRPDIVISGINRGGNLAQDIYYSGTLAAAREACLRGIPAIAISLCTEFDTGTKEHHYETASCLIVKLLESSIQNEILPEHVLNINVPNVLNSKLKGVRLTELGRRKYGADVEKRFDPRGGEYWWNKATYRGVEGSPGSDCTAILEGYASISNLNVFPATTDKSENLKTLLEQL